QSITIMNKIKIGYYVATGLLSLMLLGSVIGFYFLQTDVAQGAFTALGYPAYLVIPLGVLKLAGVATLLTRFNARVVEWAYAAFAINFSLAITAHLSVGDGEAGGAMAALVLLVISYILGVKSSS
ncbi:MAG: DoxX family protein, partial [Bacteroidota bacterium]